MEKYIVTLQAEEIEQLRAFMAKGRHTAQKVINALIPNVMMRQCLNRRIADIETVHREVAARQAHRDQLNAKINWHFTTETARIKLKRRYPTFEA